MSYFVIGTAIVSALVSANAARVQAQTNQAIARNNQQIAEAQAQDAQRRGEIEAQQAQRRARQVAGQQRATMSARGLDIGEGTPGELIDQTEFFGMQDAQTARFNAAKEAWGARMQGRGYGIQASANDPSAAFTGSLLSSAGSVASKWGGGGGFGGGPVNSGEAGGTGLKISSSGWGSAPSGGSSSLYDFGGSKVKFGG